MRAVAWLAAVLGLAFCADQARAWDCNEAVASTDSCFEQLKRHVDDLEFRLTQMEMLLDDVAEEQISMLCEMNGHSMKACEAKRKALAAKRPLHRQNPAGAAPAQ